MNLDVASILVIVGSVVASAGVIGKSRLERWDAAVHKLVFGQEALHRLIVHKIDGFLAKTGVLALYMKLFNLVLIALILSLGIALPLYTFFLVGLYWATNGRMGISPSEHPTLPEFLDNAALALIWFWTALVCVIFLYVGGLIVVTLAVRVIILPYRIVHKIEAQATLERALTLTGLFLGIAGVLVSRLSGP
jgi:hypothetical protein